jgi:hypothetical protein
MTMPKSWLMVCTSSLGLWSKAALMRFDERVPAMGTKVSRGIDSIAALAVLGSRWMSTITSLRCPETSAALPKCWAAAALSLALLSEPATRMFWGSPAPAG